MPAALPLDLTDLHPSASLVPLDHDRHHFEPLQPEIPLDTIASVPVHPADSFSRQEEEPCMNRGVCAVNSGARGVVHSLSGRWDLPSSCRLASR